MQKPRIPKGTRDYSPEEVRKRYYIINIIRKHFYRFGFFPIETPSFENISVLTGKYGEEADLLMFKILNSGDFMKYYLAHFEKSKEDPIEYFSYEKILSKISEKALRYDLTVPLARYVVMHKNEIKLPFKRYQIQPVWRADRPQKGRYREFYQCDADIVGSRSLWQEIELLLLYYAVFTDLKLPIMIKFNHRELLVAIANIANIKEHWVTFTSALDKWEKIGSENVWKEMLEKGITNKSLKKIKGYFQYHTTDIKNILKRLSNNLASVEKSKIAIKEIFFVWDNLQRLGMENVKLCLNLVRGLNYYTGMIWEIYAKNVNYGSIGGGGRYDELTGIFGLKDVPGVGISFGLERIFLSMEKLNLFRESPVNSLPILFINFGVNEALQSIHYIQFLRKKGIAAELYPEQIKLTRQLKYANQRKIRFVVLVGDKEIREESIVLKNLITGTKKVYHTLDELASHVKRHYVK